ncbi:hypothetical protein ARMGADRAFT_1122488 [Armillaria gallica]|uniref:Uncharacterized protein n=1 Tax=Armillaria gallica TaxID=47427 RepID=A0A2H3D8S8_ARMGA|nr:hypothetical protein ARMGADRAFT_1122488 [Armillaria gallica]
MSTLQDFHEYWWGNDSPLTENTVIHLPAFSDLHIFAFSRSRLLVRKDYIYVFERLQRFCETPMCYKRGIVLDGHSGIGKSVFLFYTLIRCLQESRDVIFHFVCRTLVFSKDGVKEIGLDFPYDSFSSPIWCLIDSYGGEPPPLELVSHTYIFPILASSRPDELRSRWAKRKCASRIILSNPWSDEEISIGAELLSRDEASLVLYQSLLPQALNFCGPIIQDIRNCLLCEGATTIIDQIYGPQPRVYNPASLVQVLKTFHCSTWESIYTPCSAALMFRRPAAYAGGSDDVYFDFRSPRLAQEAWSQLIHLGYEDALACFSRFGLNPATTVAGRWLFQVIARKQICRQTAQLKLLAHLQEMSLAEGTKTFIDTRICNHYCPPINSAERTPVFYSSTTEILCNTTSFYIPRKVSKDLLFDGLFFGHDPLSDYSGSTRDPTALYIFQTTTEAKNGLSELGVDTICEILHRYPGLVPTYLLVVPLPNPNQPMATYKSPFPADDPTSTWTMPQSWFQKCPGRVFWLGSSPKARPSQAKPSLEKPGPGTGLIQGSGSGFDLRKPKPRASGQGFEITPMWLLKVVFLILECQNVPQYTSTCHNQKKLQS